MQEARAETAPGFFMRVRHCAWRSSAPELASAASPCFCLLFTSTVAAGCTPWSAAIPCYFPVPPVIFGVFPVFAL